MKVGGGAAAVDAKASAEPAGASRSSTRRRRWPEARTLAPRAALRAGRRGFLGWKLAAVLEGAPETLLATYEEERRPIAAEVLGVTTKLLEAAKRGVMRRGREVHQLDLGYPESSLAMEKPKRSGGILAGDRASDAPVRGVAGMPTRRFKLFQGPHWTLLGYGLDRLSAVKPRPGLHIHAVGPHGDIVDDGGHLRAAYGVSLGDWVLVRPDGYIGAIVSSDHAPALEAYLASVGLPSRG